MPQGDGRDHLKKPSCEIFINILDSLEANVYVADMQTYEILYSNKYLNDRFGDVDGKICWQVLQSGQSGPCDFCTNAKLVDSDGRPGEPHRWEFQNTRIKRWFDIRDRAIEWPDGRVVRLAIAHDITDRKRMEETLTRAQQVARMGSWEWDVATNEVRWTGEIYNIYGHDPDSFSPDYKTVTDAMHPDSLGPFLEAIDKALKNEAPLEMDYTLIRPDGETRTIHTKGEVVFDSEGKPVQMFGTVYDITERKRLEEEAEKLAAIVRQSGEGIATAGLDGIVTFANKSWARMHGYEPEELVGKHLSIFHTEEQLREEVLPFNEMLKVSDNYSGEVGHKKKDGTVFPTYMTSTLMRDKSGNVLGMAGLAVDITSRKLMEAELRQSLKDKDMLIKEINHRVKNNLAIITSLLRLQSRFVKGHEAKGLFKESENRVQAMSMLHERLYRTEDVGNIDCREYLSSLTTQIYHTYTDENSGIRLLTDIADIRLDIDTLIPCGLIINELITNSLKHAFSGNRKGEIGVSLKGVAGDKCILSVRDNGVGIDPALDIPHATSMGLLIVNSLTSQLRGSMEVQREGGTAFLITFGKKQLSL